MRTGGHPWVQRAMMRPPCCRLSLQRGAWMGEGVEGVVAVREGGSPALAN